MWSAQTDDQLIEFHAHSPALYSTNIRDQCFYGGPVHCTAETMEYQRSECWHLHARVRPLDDFPLQVSEAPVQTRISMFIFQRTWFMAIIRIRNWIHEAIVGRYVSSNCRTRIFYIFFFFQSIRPSWWNPRRANVRALTCGAVISVSPAWNNFLW